MNKMIKWTLSAAAALLGAGVTLYGADGLGTSQAQEAPKQSQARSIQGSISIKGGMELNTANVNNAPKLTGWLNGAGAPPTVVSRSGDFATYVHVGDSVIMGGIWTFGSSVPALWSVGGFTFNLTASTKVVNQSGFLVVKGTGTIVGGPNFDPTAGTWSFSTQNPAANGIFSFSASTTASPSTPTPTP